MPKLRYLDLRPVTPEERVIGAQTRLKEYMEGMVYCFGLLCFNLLLPCYFYIPYFHNIKWYNKI